GGFHGGPPAKYVRIIHTPADIPKTATVERTHGPLGSCRKCSTTGRRPYRYMGATSRCLECRGSRASASKASYILDGHSCKGRRPRKASAAPAAASHLYVKEQSRMSDSFSTRSQLEVGGQQYTYC